VISVVICSVDERKFSAVCENYRHILDGEPMEIIGIHDAKSMCEGYNRGFSQSRGDVLIFCHDDIEIIAPDFSRKLRAHLERFDVLGVAGTTRLVGPKWAQAGPPYVFGQIAHIDEAQGCYYVLIWNAALPAHGSMQALDGVFLCVKRPVVARIPFDEETFRGFHMYDLDFSYRAFRAGFRLAVCNDLPLIHASQARGFEDDQWQKEAERFVRKHSETLAPDPSRQWQGAVVRVDSKEQLLEVLGGF